MKLHGNARTCPRSRCLAVGRVEQEGWTLARAAEAAGVSVRTLSKWLRRFREEGKPGLHDRSSAPSVIPHRTPEERVVAIAALRPVADDGRRDRRVSEDAALDRLSGADQDRAGQAVWARAGRACEPLRAQTARRAPPHRHQEARPYCSSRPPCHGQPQKETPRDRLGIRPRLRR